MVSSFFFSLVFVKRSVTGVVAAGGTAAAEHTVGMRHILHSRLGVRIALELRRLPARHSHHTGDSLGNRCTVVDTAAHSRSAVIVGRFVLFPTSTNNTKV
jgi:hypothetical protein